VDALYPGREPEELPENVGTFAVNPPSGLEDEGGKNVGGPHETLIVLFVFPVQGVVFAWLNASDVGKGM